MVYPYAAEKQRMKQVELQVSNLVAVVARNLEYLLIVHELLRALLPLYVLTFLYCWLRNYPLVVVPYLVNTCCLCVYACPFHLYLLILLQFAKKGSSRTIDAAK